MRQEEAEQDSQRDVQAMGGATEWLRYTTSTADSRHEMFGTRPMTMGRCGDSL